jgi:hypothetical protein
VMESRPTLRSTGGNPQNAEMWYWYHMYITVFGTKHMLQQEKRHSDIQSQVLRHAAESKAGDAVRFFIQPREAFRTPFAPLFESTAFLEAPTARFQTHKKRYRSQPYTRTDAGRSPTSFSLPPFLRAKASHYNPA